MATGINIKTYFEGAWHDGDVPIMRAADHGAWLGTTVFDGARFVDGIAPDLLPHCERVVSSARALMCRVGIQRTKHLTTRALWIQSLVSRRVLTVRKVGTQSNVADLFTKALGKSTRTHLLSLLL